MVLPMLKKYYYSVTTTWEFWAKTDEEAMERSEDAAFLKECPCEISNQDLIGVEEYGVED